MIHMHPLHIFLHIFIQPNFKSTIEFVGSTLVPTNLIMNLKMRCIFIIF
jgi:hypothetical protein